MDPKNRIDHLDELLLREEGEGILLLAIQGAIKHLWELKNGGDFVLTETQQNRVDKLLNESQSVRFFVQDHIGVDEVKKGVCNALRAKNAMRSGTPFFNEIRPDGPKKGVHEDGSDQEKGVHDPQSDLERGFLRRVRLIWRPAGG